MVRIVAVLLIVGPILDVYVLNGSYTQTAGRIFIRHSSIFDSLSGLRLG